MGVVVFHWQKCSWSSWCQVLFMLCFVTFVVFRNVPYYIFMCVRFLRFLFGLFCDFQDESWSPPWRCFGRKATPGRLHHRTGKVKHLDILLRGQVLLFIYYSTVITVVPPWPRDSDQEKGGPVSSDIALKLYSNETKSLIRRVSRPYFKVKQQVW